MRSNGDNRSVEHVRDLRNQIARLTQLLHEFRNLSRRQNYQLVPTNLNQLVIELLTAETDQYAARGVTIVHDSAPDLPLVKADANKLRQVLLNLCKNAVEAIRPWRDLGHILLALTTSTRKILRFPYRLVVLQPRKRR
jgi:signal transduction histidine kinase